MKIHIQPCPLTLSEKLVQLLEQTVTEASFDKPTDCIIHFRDQFYFPDSGGYQPVEIAVSKTGCLHYITDFIYVGTAPYFELVKDLDVDFQSVCFQQRGREYPLAAGAALFALWQSNFMQYFEMGVYGTSVQEN